MTPKKTIKRLWRIIFVRHREWINCTQPYSHLYIHTADNLMVINLTFYLYGDDDDGSIALRLSGCFFLRA